MKKESFSTANGLQLLRAWGGGCEYENNEKWARSAAARLFKSGVLVFEHGNKPRTAAEFFEAMPYTSTSDFAAVWVCNWQISRRYDSNLYLDGIALTDKNAVAVWTRNNDDGDEIATEYEILEGTK